jgi:hypothetical protein
MMNDNSTCPDELDHGFGSFQYLQYKNDFYGGKHHLEVDKMHFYSALMTSPPDPLSAMERSDSWKPYAERGKEIEKGSSLSEPPFSEKTSPSLLSRLMEENVQAGFRAKKRSSQKQAKLAREFKDKRSLPGVRGKTIRSH